MAQNNVPGLGRTGAHDVLYRDRELQTLVVLLVLKTNGTKLMLKALEISKALSVLGNSQKFSNSREGNQFVRVNYKFKPCLIVLKFDSKLQISTRYSNFRCELRFDQKFTATVLQILSNRIL
jgi:hypothetical protein